MEREEAIQLLVKRTIDMCDGAFNKKDAEELNALLNTAAGKQVSHVVKATAEWCKDRSMYGVNAI